MKRHLLPIIALTVLNCPAHAADEGGTRYKSNVAVNITYSNPRAKITDVPVVVLNGRVAFDVEQSTKGNRVSGCEVDLQSGKRISCSVEARADENRQIKYVVSIPVSELISALNSSGQYSSGPRRVLMSVFGSHMQHAKLAIAETVAVIANGKSEPFAKSSRFKGLASNEAVRVNISGDFTESENLSR